ncbi:flavodoxin family protein [Chloroflexota bacterium]
MKALGISGSPRPDGNCMLITGHALKAMAEEGFEAELLSLAGLKILGCDACMACMKEERCIIEDDLMPIYEKMKEADAIIISTPVYFGSATALVKGLLERTGYIVRNNRGTFKGKVGGPIVVAGRAGLTFTFAQMNYWFQTLDFFMAGVAHWTIATGRKKGEVARDKEGMDAAWNLGKRLAFLAKSVQDSGGGRKHW